MNDFSAGIDRVQTWFQRLSKPPEPFLQTNKSLSHFFIRIRAPATGTRKPCPQTTSTSSATFEDTFVASGFVLFVITKILIWPNGLSHIFRS